jgi:tRNA(fMet)-specific endonuclease VapC
VGELYFGAYNSTRVEANVERVRAFLSPPGPQVVMIDEPAAEQFGRYKALLRREGRSIGDIDLFIAGVASHHGLTVVTNNTAHFDRLPDLVLENWLEPPRRVKILARVDSLEVIAERQTPTHALKLPRPVLIRVGGSPRASTCRRLEADRDEERSGLLNPAIWLPAES